MPTFEEKITANVDHIIEQSRRGDGLLTPYFAKLRKGIAETAATNNEFRKQSGGTTLNEEQLNAAVNQQLDETIAQRIRPALLKTAKGESADVNLNDVASLAGAVGHTASSLESGNILGLLTSIPHLINNSIVADFFRALFSFITERKPIGETMQELKFQRSVSSTAAGLEVDASALAQALTAEPVQPTADARSVPIPDDVRVPGVSGGTRAEPQDHESAPPVTTETVNPTRTTPSLDANPAR